jgi:hypothetical protein
MVTKSKTLLKTVVDEIEQINREVSRLYGTQAASIWFAGGAMKINDQDSLRFDWLIELAGTLRIWLDRKLTTGELILAWTNLGSLLKGTLKGFLSIYGQDYAKEKTIHRSMRATEKNGNLKHPGKLRFEDLKIFFTKEAAKQNSVPPILDQYDLDTIEVVQRNRNVIHAFMDKPLDSQSAFENSLYGYCTLQKKLFELMP